MLFDAFPPSHPDPHPANEESPMSARHNQRFDRALRRTVAAATSFAVAVSAVAVPVLSTDTGARAVAQTEYTLGATATKDSLGGGGWLGTIRLANGDYTPKTIRSVRLHFGSNAGAGLGFPAEDTYDVRLVRGTSQLQDLGTLTGFGGSDTAGNRWLDVDLPEDVTLTDGAGLQIRKPGAANTLPIRAGVTAQGPTATGYPEARLSTPTEAVTPTVTAGPRTVTVLAPATTVTPTVTRTTSSTTTAAPTTVTQQARPTTTTPRAIRTTTPTVTAAPITTTVQAPAVTITPTATIRSTPTVTAPTNTVTVTAPAVTRRAQAVTVTPVVTVTSTPTETVRLTTTPTAMRQVTAVGPTQTVTAPTVSAPAQTVTNTPTNYAESTVTAAPVTVTQTLASTITPTVTEKPSSFGWGPIEVSAGEIKVAERVPQLNSDPIITTMITTPPTTVVQTLQPTLETRTFVTTQNNTPVTSTTTVMRPPVTTTAVRPGEPTTVTSALSAVEPRQSEGFTTGRVVKVGDNGSTEPVETAAEWIEVQPNGALVVAPPTGTKAGEYRVEVIDPTGEPETVTVTVRPELSMAERYVVTAPDVVTPAGSEGLSAIPRADVTEGGLRYPDRALPKGTKFGTTHPGASVDKHGRVRFTPSANAKPGRVNVPVNVTFPDDSTGSFTVVFEVGEPLMQHRFPVAYGKSAAVPAGSSATVSLGAHAQLPKGTTFGLRNGAGLDGWLVSVNEETGAVRATPPSSNAKALNVPVVAFFPDGSTRELNAQFEVAGADSQAAQTNPPYKAATAVPGTNVRVALTGEVPAGTRFELVGTPSEDITVDPVTGEVTVAVPEQASEDEPLTTRVRALFPDGSAREITATVNVVNQATAFKPEFPRTEVRIGEKASLSQVRNVPVGTKFAIPDTFKKDGWTVTINEETGQLSVTTNATVPNKQEVLVPVSLTYPDGSTATVAVPVTAVQPTSADGAATGSSTIDIVVVLIGALAAIGATGYALWLNQDEVRRFLNQLGINI